MTIDRLLAAARVAHQNWTYDAEGDQTHAEFDAAWRELGAAIAAAEPTPAAVKAEPRCVEVTRWENHYHCDDCNTSWADEHCCNCNDRCPTCEAETEPNDDSRELETFSLVRGSEPCPVCGSPHDF